MLAFEQNGDSALLDSAERLCDSLEMGELTKEGKMILYLRKPQVLMARGRVRDAMAWKCQYLSAENIDEQTCLQFAQMAFYAGKEESMRQFATHTLKLIENELSKTDIDENQRQQLLFDKLQIYIIIDEYEQSQVIAKEINELDGQNEFKDFYNETRASMISMQKKYAGDTISQCRDIVLPVIH